MAGPDAAGAGAPSATGGGLDEVAMAEWGRRRGEATGTLRAMEQAIRAIEHPLGDKAIIEVRSVTAQLTAVPDTAAKVAELVRYLTEDPVFDDLEEPNGFGIEVRMRKDLLEVLQQRGAPA